MAQVLMGYDETGSVRLFDEDGDIIAGGTKLKECYFVNFARLLTKDEIKKGSFELELGVNSDHDQAGGVFTKRIKLTDTSGSNGYFVNSPAGEYGVLYATASAGDSVLSASLADDGLNQPPCGLLFYQAGIAVLSSSVLTSDAKATTTIIGTAALNGEDGTNFILTNADGSTVTFHTDPTKAFGDTSSDGGDHTWEVNTLNISGGDEIRKATQALHIACLTAIAAGELDMTAVPATDTGTQTSFTLTQNTAGTAGNTAITVVTGVTAAAATFTGGTSNDSPILSVDNEIDMSSAGGTETISDMLTGSTISTIADSIRNRIYNIQFNNTTELNSTIYFCRVNNTEFNYSANPTYLSSSGGPSEIVVKDGNEANDPISYITSVGLYSPDNELLAVAKVSEPLKKDPSNELTLRVRLDY